MYEKIDHIGIAVSNLKEAIKIYSEKFGLPCSGIEELAERKVKIALFPVGESKIELLQSTSPDGTIAKFIEKRGEGIQHIAFRVDDLEAVLTRLTEKGIQPIDEKPRSGVGGTKIAFIQPKSMCGVLIELVQK